MKTLELFLSQIDNKNTKRSYNTDLKQMFYYIKKPSEQLTRIDLLNYQINFLKKQNYSSATIDRKIRSINSFVAFLNDNQINTNVCALKSVKVKNKEKEVLGFDNSKKLIQIATNPRDKAILAVFLSTGLRANEVINLKLQDFLSGQDIIIYGKGDKKNIIRFSPQTRKYIEEYLKVRLNSKKYDNLFISNQGTPMNASVMNKTWKKLCERLGTDKQITNHSFRHDVITKVADEYGVHMAQQVANHSSIKTTMLYVDKNREQTLNIMGSLL